MLGSVCCLLHMHMHRWRHITLRSTSMYGFVRACMWAVRQAGRHASTQAGKPKKAYCLPQAEPEQMIKWNMYRASLVHTSQTCLESQTQPKRLPIGHASESLHSKQQRILPVHLRVLRPSKPSTFISNPEALNVNAANCNSKTF